MEGSSIALLVLMLALAASGLVALEQECLISGLRDDDRQLFFLPLHGNDQDRTRLALTTYDVSLAGFTNRSDHWFAFPGHEERIPASTPLPFGNSYRDLISGLANLPGVHVGHEAWLEAIHALSSYDPATADANDVEALKRALATLTVTTSEATRLTPIRETVVKKGREKVVAEHLPYIEHLDTICRYEILRKLMKERAHIHSMEEAFSVVRAIAYGPMAVQLMAHSRSA